MSTGTRVHRTSGRHGPTAADPVIDPQKPLRQIGWSWLPSAFVVFSLLMLLAVPLLLERRISAVRTARLEPAQDARSVVNDVRQTLSEAEASLRGYLLTGDDRLRDAMMAAHALEADALAELAVHAPQLGPRFSVMVQQLARASERARQRQLAAARTPDESALAVTAHAELVDQSAAVRAAVIAEVEQARELIRSYERTGVLAMLGLGGLALSASLLVILLAQRDRRTALLEAELRAVALTLAEATGVDDILARVAASAARSVAGASTFVERIDDHDGDVVVVTTSGPDVLPPGTRMKYPGSLTEAAIRSGTPEQFRVSSMAERPSTGPLQSACPDCAGVVIPLVTEQDAHGALVLLRRGEHGFRPAEIMQLRMFGIFAALALRKGMLLARAVEQQRELERAARTRERMIRGFSHDLKNPLGAADGHAALLDEGMLGELSADQQQHLRHIRASLRTALDIIEDVVDLARAEAGQLPMRQVPLDPAALVDDLASEYEPAAEAAGLELEVAEHGALPTLETDPRRVRQVLGNLVSNAIKYTPAGGRVRLAVELQAGGRAEDPRHWIRFVVADTGPGIPPDDVPRLFQEFERGGTGAARGAGLGLAISDRIARLLGGEITVSSEPGHGSEFTLWLPYTEDGGEDDDGG